MNRMICSIARWKAACLLSILLSASFGAASQGAENSPHILRALFLGDNGHHRPADRFKQLEPVLAARGIELNYTDSLESLNPANLAGYDCIVIFANHTRIEPDQEEALLGFVNAGGGLAALHCASYCFLNSPRYIELVGAQFRSHGTGVFKETITHPDHPVMRNLEPVESWDESYVHTRHNPDRTVLAERRHPDGAEPWTWVREHGNGRVFYTAWGHDQRTWSHEGFQALAENGIRWASAQSPTRLVPRTGLAPFEYMEPPSPLPNYVAGARWGTLGEPIGTMQKPLDPSESAQHMVTFPEFKTQLFAAEPQLSKPIWLAWDADGRLWLAETIDYPNEMQPPGQGRDRLTICEDTDADGTADKFIVFADQLSVPTSFVFANGGVIVIHSGKTEFFKDTTGDDRADVRELLFSGWGTGDTHAGPSNLRYGFDGWIWGTVGYSGFRGTVGGEEVRFGQGIFRFKPDGSKLEFIRSSNNNTWGLGFNEENVLFGSTANGNASMYMPIPNRYYEAVNGWSASRLESIADSQRFYPITEKIRQVDFHGRYTAGSGSALYTARSFPRDYWNRVQFVAEPTGHLLGKFHIEPRGADFVAHNGRNFLASDDEWSSPIAAEVGPDGALWVIDWYNYIIQHNPTPLGFQTGRGNAYETPLRDKTHGRIYRVAYAGAEPSPSPRLSSMAPSEWIAVLKNNNMLWRLHAQRLIVEGGHQSLVPALIRLAADPSVDEIGLNTPAIHALWTLHGLGAINADAAATAAAQGALSHPSAGVRRAAVMVLPRDVATAGALIERGVLNDSDAQVRLAALLALSETPSLDAAGPAILAMLRDPSNSEDRWISDAVVSAAAKNDATFLRAVLAGYRPSGSPSATASPASNLIPNASFEQGADNRPSMWRTTVHSGRGGFEWAASGRTGNRAVMIQSEQGGDLSWAISVPVEPRADYLLTGWIKVENVRKLGNAYGAMLNIHELQDPVGGGTQAITGNADWTQVTLNFNSGEMRRVTVNCLFGGWGRAAGTAWFDDIELIPAPGSELTGAAGRVVRLVTTHYARRGPVDSIVSTLGALRGAAEVLAVPVLDGLVAGWPKGTLPQFAPADKQTLNEVMESMPESVRDRLLALAQRWEQPGLFGARFDEIAALLKQQIRTETLGAGERAASAKRLLGIHDARAATDFIVSQIGLLTPPDVASGFINALTESSDPETAQALLAHWTRFTPAARRAAVAALMRRGDWTRALLDAIDEGALQRTDLAAEHWSQLKQNPNRLIARRAERLSAPAGGVSVDRAEIVNQLLPLAGEKGDAARGAEVFTANCAVCHLVKGQGGLVGPDLTGVGSRPRADILLEILDPNRSVEANYRLWTVETKDDETYSGRLDAETQTTVEILDTTGQKHVIQRDAIASMQASPLSIMPSGFEALPPEDITALLEYLAQQ